MSKKMKYILIDDCYPVLFSQASSHTDFASRRATSAGFCHINYDDKTCRYSVHCFGESITLKIGSKERDH